MALALVLHQGIALGHGPQPDALLEIVHLVQVLRPALPDDRQQHPALQVAHGLGAQLLLTLLVADLRIREDLLLQEVRRETGKTAGFLHHFLVRDRDRVDGAQSGPQLVQVPVLGVSHAGAVGDGGGDDLLGELLDLPLDVLAHEDPTTVAVDHLALAVEHVIVLQHVLALLGIAPLHLVLGVGDTGGDQAPGHRDVIRGDGHQTLGGTRVEQAHEVVREGQVEPGLPGIALTTRAAAELVVDAAGLVALRAEHVQAARLQDVVVLAAGGGLALLEHRGPLRLVLLGVSLRVQPQLGHLLDGVELGVAAQHDVRAAPGHVRGDRDRALAPGLGYNRGLTGVVLGVEHLVAHPALGEQPGKVLGLLHRGRAHEHGLALLVALLDVPHHSGVLGGLVLVDHVPLVLAGDAPVRRNGDDADLVRVHELRRLGLGGARHAGELVVETEVVLQGDRGHRLVLGLDLHTLLGLDGLVDTLVVAATGEHTTGVLVHDLHLATGHDVVLVVAEQLLGLDGVVQEPDQRRVLRLVEVLDPQPVLDLLDPGLEHAHGAFLLVHLVVGLRDELFHDGRELAVPAVRLPGGRP